MPILWYIGLIVATSVGALFAAMMGLGGGIFYTPLQLAFDIDIHQTATTSLVLIAMVSMTSTVTYHLADKIDWKLAGVLESTTVLGSGIAGFFSKFIPSTILEWVLAIVLVISGISMLVHTTAHPEHHRGTSWYHWHRTRGTQSYTVNLLVALPISFVAGALSALVGIGGGVIKVPLMAVVLGIPMTIAVATSSLMVGITALGGFAGHVAAGHWNWKLCLLLIPGVLIGARVGAYLMLETHAKNLKKIFGIVIIIVATALVFRIL